MAQTARGSFTVQMTPQGEPAAADGVSTGRMAVAGIQGTFWLRIVDGQHLYEFEYTLP